MSTTENTFAITNEEIRKYGDAINHAGWNPTSDNQWYTTGFKEVHCTIPMGRNRELKTYTTALVMTHDGVTENMSVIIGFNGNDTTTLVLMNQEHPEETALECFNGDDRASRVGHYVHDKVLENIAGRK